ncbi:MAG: succinate dehydrogenase, hydrophobic membrane anchor protein [Roseomonas sp.]
MAEDSASIRSLRSPLGRVRGMGSAKGGTRHWWLQRVTSIALLPLSIWLIFSLARLVGAEYAVVLEWIGNTFNAVLLLAFLTAAFHHAAAGLQVVIEDYVRGELQRFAAICGVNGLAVLLWLAASLSILRIAL